MQDAIDRESEQFGDILQGDFADGDSDDGRIRKHLMGLRWASDQTDDCRPVFVVKAEDDAFVEIFHLAKFVQAIYGDSPGERSEEERRQKKVAYVVPDQMRFFRVGALEKDYFY